MPGRFAVYTDLTYARIAAKIQFFQIPCKQLLADGPAGPTRPQVMKHCRRRSVCLQPVNGSKPEEAGSQRATPAALKINAILVLMKKIAIISASVRQGRKSHRVALWFRRYLEQNTLAETDIIDLAGYRFPLFEERLKMQQSPSPEALELADRVRRADGVIIVTPEYNGGYPASLKNVIDLLTDEWRRKIVAISTVSDGQFGGMQVITSLQFTLWKTGAITVPALFPVPFIDETFSETGVPADAEAMNKRSARFTGELLWFIEAKARMES